MFGLYAARRRFLGATFWIAPILTAGALPLTEANGAEEIHSAAGTIHLVIDYSSGVQKSFAGIPWKPGMRILGALEAAKSIPPGLSFSVWTSRGGTEGIAEIDGVEGWPRSGRSGQWLMWVNENYVGDILEASNSVFSEEDKQRITDKVTLKPGSSVLFKLSSRLREED